VTYTYMLDERTCITVAAWGWQTCPTHSTITRDDDTLTMFSRAVYKIFKESNKDVICHIRQCLGLHDVDVLCKERHEIFLRRTGLLRYAVLHSLTAQYSFFTVHSFCSLVVFFNFLGVQLL